ncbi:HAD family hydrolase [Humibacter ginsenosidimutans]|uniref:HAD family hydrolase n=1 Tax=Humibacter ginsenosidimutans TaxID=2599293 RepID=A0A5B8M3C2_9MICO|nr:HAD family hydrolase [Humibacter ginsenosidimutans]QDZ14651.1 HAD family hydrolase [Humibacter ginsenosidimutans]
MLLAALDLDGTLVDQAAAAREWTVEFVSRWDLPRDAAAGVAPMLTARGPKDAAFDRLVETWSLPVSGPDLLSAYRRRMPQLVHCTNADKDALRRLRAAGWRIGVVTNGSVENQLGKIRATGLSDLVDGWVISEQAGVRKPDPVIFEMLAECVGSSLEGWMLGDSLDHDVAGGAAAGLSTAWITSAPVADARPAAGAPAPGASAPTITAPTVADAVTRILACAGEPEYR